MPLDGWGVLANSFSRAFVCHNVPVVHESLKPTGVFLLEPIKPFGGSKLFEYDPVLYKSGISCLIVLELMNLFQDAIIVPYSYSFRLDERLTVVFPGWFYSHAFFRHSVEFGVRLPLTLSKEGKCQEDLISMWFPWTPTVFSDFSTCMLGGGRLAEGLQSRTK